MSVGRRKDLVPVVLEVNSERASDDGVVFYQGNHTVWLADHVPSKYLCIVKDE
ncbi:RNA 2'-phosphotransferase [compost metagenome]